MSETVASIKAEPTFDPKAETLSGDIRDWLLDKFRLLDKPWTKLSEAQQRRLIDRADEMGRTSVRRVLDLVTAHKFPTIEIQVGKFKGGEKGEVKFDSTCQDTDGNLLAVARAGRAVLVLANPQVFFGERAAATAEPDQPAMDLGGGDADQHGLNEGERIDPETGEIIAGQAPPERLALPAPGTAGIPLDEAQRRFEAARDKALTKKAERERKANEKARTNTRAKRAVKVAGEPVEAERRDDPPGIPTAPERELADA